MRRFLKICPAVLAFASLMPGLAAQQPAPDAREIIRRALEAEEQNGLLTRPYTWKQREVEKQLDAGGAVKSQEAKTWKISPLYDERYARLTRKNDKALEPRDQRREDERFEKFAAKRKSETSAERQSRLDDLKKERDESRGFLRDFPNAYDFRLAGEEQIDGNATWVIDATPRRDFHPTQPHGDLLPKIKGRLWIEKRGYHWVRVDAEAVDTIAIGVVIARIHPGSRGRFERMLVNNEVWMPRRFYFNAGARVALVKSVMVEQIVEFSDFRKQQ